MEAGELVTAVIRPPRYLLQNGLWIRYPWNPIPAPSATVRFRALAGRSVYTDTGDPGEPSDSFVLGVTMPDATTTGVRAGGPLETLTGDLTLTDGMHLSRKRIVGSVIFSHQNTSLTDCEIVGRAPGGTFRSDLVIANCTTSGAKMSFCSINPQGAARTYYMNGIGNADSKGYLDVVRCNVWNCVDSTNYNGPAAGGRMNHYGCWFHHMAFYKGTGVPPYTGGDHASDTRRPYWTHNDHGQMAGGQQYRYIGCRFDGYIAHSDPAHTSHPGYILDAAGNWDILYADPEFGWAAGNWAGMWGSGLAVTAKASAVTGELIGCWIDGTEVGFQMPQQGSSYPASGCDWTIAGNRWGATHPYDASGGVKRFELARMSSGIGTITYSKTGTNLVYGEFIVPVFGENIFANSASVVQMGSYGSVVTPSGWAALQAVVPGNLVHSSAGSSPPAQPLPFTVRIIPG